MLGVFMEHGVFDKHIRIADWLSIWGGESLSFDGLSSLRNVFDQMASSIAAAAAMYSGPE